MKPLWPILREKCHRMFFRAGKKESIKARIVLPFIVFVVLLLLLAAYGSFLLQQYHLNAEADSKVASINHIFTSFLTQESLRLGSQLEFIARDEKLLAAWQEKNRYQLYEAAQPLYERLKRDYGVSHFYFIDQEKMCFLRVHTPSHHGDLLNRHTLNEAAREDKVFSGIELGPLGTFTLRVVYPWKHENKLIGYLELGEEIEQITPFLKTTLGLDLLFIIDKQNIDRQSFEAGCQSFGKTGNWEDFAQFVVINNTLGNMAPRLQEFLAEHYSHEETGRANIVIGGRYYRIADLPLIDAAKHAVGKMVVLYDTTEKITAYKRIVINIFVVVFSIMGMLFIFFYYYTDHLEEKMETYRSGLEKNVEERTVELAMVNEKLMAELAERKKIQDQLKRSQDEWRKSFDGLTDIVTIQRRDMQIVKANKAAHDLFGKGGRGVVGKYCYEVFRGLNSPCEGCPVSEILFDFGKHTEIVNHQRLNKTFFVSSSPILDEKGEVEFIVHVAKDITEQKKLEEELLQSRKLEAIGTLAGGIAHDFNNILMAILGYVELAREEISDNVQAVADLDEAIRGAQRARELVRQILVFSRKEEYEIEPLFPHLIVKESLKLMRASLPASVEIQENIDPDCGLVLADPVKIQQILMNLCTNALHAMEDEEGILKVSLTRTELTADDVIGDYKITPGPFVELKVSDTGHGMDEATQARIFEPFFTTKDVDKGTGMGLAVVHGIVRDFGGVIRVESAPGKGAAFSVYLPAMVEEKAGEQKEAAKAEELPPVTGKILCVDDEETIVHLQKSFLERHGYEVVGFTSSVDALDHFRKTRNSWDLMITDQTMPQMTGEKLVREVLKIRPDLPIIICTGYSSQISEEKARSLGIKAYALKPIDMKYFELLVRGVLSEAKG